MLERWLGLTLIVTAVSATYSLTDAAADHTAAGIAFVDANDMEQAIESFRAAAKFTPGPEVWNNLAEALADEAWAGSYTAVGKAAAAEARRKAAATAAGRRRRRRKNGEKRRRRRGKASAAARAATAKAAAAAAEEHWQLITPPDGSHPYYWNAATGVSSWTDPTPGREIRWPWTTVAFGNFSNIWWELVAALVLFGTVWGNVIYESEVLVAAIAVLALVIYHGLTYLFNAVTVLVVLRLIVVLIYRTTGCLEDMQCTNPAWDAKPEGTPRAPYAYASNAVVDPSLNAAFVGARTKRVPKVKVGPNANRSNKHSKRVLNHVIPLAPPPSLGNGSAQVHPTETPPPAKGSKLSVKSRWQKFISG